MTDVALEMPDGSDFTAEPETKPKFDLQDRLGLDKIDFDAVGYEWHLTENGVYVVDLGNLDPEAEMRDIPRFKRGNPLTGLIEIESEGAKNPDRTIAYVASAEVLRDWKQSLGIEGGFAVIGRSPTDERTNLPGRQFFADRARGFWTIQSPKEGVAIADAKQKVDTIIHDLEPDDHILIALSGTDNQVEQIARLRDKSLDLSGEWKPFIVGKIMPAVVDTVFSKNDQDRFNLSGADAFINRLNGWIEASLRADDYYRRDLDRATIEVTDIVRQIFEEADDETDFDSDAEAKIAEKRYRTILQSL